MRVGGRLGLGRGGRGRRGLGLAVSSRVRCQVMLMVVGPAGRGRVIRPSSRSAAVNGEGFELVVICQLG